MANKAKMGKMAATTPAQRKAFAKAVGLDVEGEMLTGLGESLPEITAKVQVLTEALAKELKVKPKDLSTAALEAAYQYGLAEKRRRRLARKVA